MDLRNEDELRPDLVRPAGLTTVHVPLDGVEDADFWDEWGTGPQFGTPLYYRPHLERFPERNAAVLRRSGAPSPAGCWSTAWAAGPHGADRDAAAGPGRRAGRRSPRTIA